MRAFDEQGKTFTEYLQNHAGEDPRKDSFYSGYITAVKDLLQVKLDKDGGLA